MYSSRTYLSNCLTARIGASAVDKAVWRHGTNTGECSYFLLDTTKCIYSLLHIKRLAASASAFHIGVFKNEFTDQFIVDKVHSSADDM